MQTKLSNYTEELIVLDPSELLEFCGKNDSRLRQIEQEFGAKLIARGNEIKITGDLHNVEQAALALEKLLDLFRIDGKLDDRQVKYAINSIKSKEEKDLRSIYLEKIDLPFKRKQITPLTSGQKRYVEAMRGADIVFGIGPAGTGKTYLAMAMAINSLMSGKVGRLILVRPAVEAGEKLGFLPGDISSKVDPFLRPLYDALYEMMPPEKIKHYFDTSIIEVAPLAFMRGRTLNNAFVILDEGQNTTKEQMKMFLTRLGFDSRAVITGDVTQVDLPGEGKSGLIHVQDILADIKGIRFIFLDETDVVRHELVQKIIRAYEKNGRSRRSETIKNANVW